MNDRTKVAQGVREADETLSRDGLEPGAVSGFLVKVASFSRIIVAPAPGIDAEPGREPLRALLGRVRFVWVSFIIGVILPSLAAVLYLAFIASNQFVAEVRFSVRAQPAEQLNDPGLKNALSAGSSGTIPQIAPPEAYIVANYLKSRAAIEDLSGRVDVKGIYQRPEADFWAKLKSNPTAEDLQTYWASMIGTAVESTSGIVTAKARAFRPEDARSLAASFVGISEALVNTLSSRARADALRKAEDEVRRTEGMLRDALVAMRRLRDKEGFLDPISAATSTSKLLLAAMGERVKLQTDLFVLNRALATNAPGVVSLRNRIDSIDAQIEQLKSQLTNKSAEQQSISAALVRFEELELQRIFSEKLHTLAQNALERTRARAEQKQIYLNVFLPAYLPEEARYPERLALSLVIPLMLLIVWSILALTGAAINDHMV